MTIIMEAYLYLVIYPSNELLYTNCSRFLYIISIAIAIVFISSPTVITNYSLLLHPLHVLCNFPGSQPNVVFAQLILFLIVIVNSRFNTAPTKPKSRGPAYLQAPKQNR